MSLKPLKYFTTLKVASKRPFFLKRHLEHFTRRLLQAQIQPLPFPSKKFELFLEQKSRFNEIERLNLFINEKGEWSFKLKSEKPFEKQSLTLGVYPDYWIEDKPWIKCWPFYRKAFLQKATLQGWDDWIFLDSKKKVLETTLANLFWVKEKTLFFPDPSMPYYLGATLSIVLELSKNLHFELKPIKASLVDLLKADEVFYCNSMKGIVRVEKIGVTHLGKNSSWHTLFSKAYEHLARQEDELWQKSLSHFPKEQAYPLF